MNICHCRKKRPFGITLRRGRRFFEDFIFFSRKDIAGLDIRQALNCFICLFFVIDALVAFCRADFTGALECFTGDFDSIFEGVVFGRREELDEILHGNQLVDMILRFG